MKRLAPLTLACLFAASAWAAEMPEGKWWKRPRLVAEIGLSPEQGREIESIFVRSRTKLIDLRADLQKKQLALRESMEDRAADRKIVEKQIEAVESARAELQKARASMVLDMKEVLRPQQWERLLQLQQEFRDRLRNRRQ